MRHVLSAIVQNVPGVLAHISGMLASRGYNIDSLAVGETEDPNLSRMTFVVVGALVAGAAGCASMNNKEKGALIGGAAGAVVGGVIGKQAGNTAIGAITGAAVGGTAGLIIGDYMDDQAEELERDLEGADIERVGEGIKITFDSGILFDVNKSDLRPDAKTNLEKMAEVLYIASVLLIVSIPLMAMKNKTGWYIATATALATAVVSFQGFIVRNSTEWLQGGLLSTVLLAILLIPAFKQFLIEKGE